MFVKISTLQIASCCFQGVKKYVQMIEITFFVLLSQLGFLLPLAFFWVDSEDYPWKSGAKYGDTAGVHCVVHKVQEGITRLSSSPSRDLNIHRERSFFGNSLVPIIQWLLGFYRVLRQDDVASCQPFGIWARKEYLQSIGVGSNYVRLNTWSFWNYGKWKTSCTSWYGEYPMLWKVS